VRRNVNLPSGFLKPPPITAIRSPSGTAIAPERRVGIGRDADQRPVFGSKTSTESRLAKAGPPPPIA
jgi:hypothetical protein